MERMTDKPKKPVSARSTSPNSPDFMKFISSFIAGG
jgi:hypothetical protein